MTVNFTLSESLHVLRTNLISMHAYEIEKVYNNEDLQIGWIAAKNALFKCVFVPASGSFCLESYYRHLQTFRFYYNVD